MSDPVYLCMYRIQDSTRPRMNNKWLQAFLPYHWKILRIVKQTNWSTEKEKWATKRT